MRDDRTCRYCGYTFETEADREAHIRPENTGDYTSVTIDGVVIAQTRRIG